MKIAVASGGTGGHIYPGIAVAKELMSKDPSNQIFFIGSDSGPEKDIVSRENISIYFLKSKKLVRKFTASNILSLFFLFVAFFQCLKILLSEKPDIIFATGGYACFPAVICAYVLGIPVVLHEQNVLPGLSIKILSRFARKVCLSWNESVEFIKLKNTVITGNPVRQEIINAERSPQPIKSILVLGGSQGARSINEAVFGLVKKLKPENNINIFHSTGNRDFHLIKDKFVDLPKFYHPVAYMHNIWEIFKITDLVVSRAGAMTISEFAAAGLPSILIPFPYSAESHQDYNADLFKNHGAAIVIKNNELSSDKLLSIILGLFSDENRLRQMSQSSRSLAQPNAARNIIGVIYEII